MECSVCYREYRLSPTGDVAYPRVGTCGHSICNACCDKLHLHSSDPKCPYCNRENSFELQTRNFLAEDCLVLMENTDLIESLLPQLKNLVVDLIERKNELENELNEEPKGFIAWCKWKVARVLKDKEELLGLHKKVDSLIDLTTAIMRPKLSVPTVTALSTGILQIEARSLETLESGEFIYGPSIEVGGCHWKMSVVKTIINDEDYFGAGVQMTSRDNGKQYKAHGIFTINSQIRGAEDYQVRLMGTFTAPCSQLAKTDLKPWNVISVIQLKNFHRGRLFAMLLLILASISAPMILVSCAKNKKRKKKQSTTVPARSSVEKPVECTKEYPDIHEKLRTSRHTYQIAGMIGSGGYAKVFEATRESDSLKVAIKCEAMSEERKCLEQDIRLLREVHRLKSRHFPVMYDQGKVEGRFSFLVMELLYRNLTDLKYECEDAEGFSYWDCNTTLKVAQQCLIAIEQVHRAGFIHGDIKTCNFVAGPKNKPNTIHLLDFGLARRYVDNKTNRIVKPEQKVHFYGTLSFASLDAMDRMEQSRKDDLESWLYMILDFASGILPWQHDEDMGEMRQKKWDLRHWNTEFSKEYFRWSFRDFPMEQYKKMFDHIVQLDYYSSPDYKFINSILLEMMKIKKVKWEEPLEWNHSWKAKKKWGDIPYTEPVEVPGNGQPPGFKETPLKDRVKLERYIPEIEKKKKEESKQQTTSTAPVKQDKPPSREEPAKKTESKTPAK